MIIGLSGRISSGKDTVGKIIQYLAYNNIYSNKSTDAIVDIPAAIEEDPLNGGILEKYSGWQIRKYAYKLKQIAGIILGVDPVLFEDQEYKKSFLGPEWDYWDWERDSTRFASKEEAMVLLNEMWAQGGDGIPQYHQMTTRQFLQELGTEAIRNSIHPSAWINALFADFKPERYPYNNALDAYRWPNWCITDMRFPDEAEAIKKRGGITIRINRVLPDIDYPTLESLHKSETSLDDYEFDYVIENTGSLSDLVEIVKGIMADVSEKAV